MDRVVSQVEEERPGPVLLDEPDRLVGEAVGQILVIVPSTQAGGLESEVPAGRRARLGPADVPVEALAFGPERRPAQVPLADAGRTVSGRLERLGERELLEGQVLADRRTTQLLGRPVGPPRQPVREVQPRGVLAGHDGGSRRGADRAGRVAVGEPHAPARQGIDVGGLVIRAAVTAEVGPAEVVQDDQHDVGPRGLVCDGGRREARDQEETEHGRTALARFGPDSDS